MKKCKNCEGLVRDNDKYCRNCGIVILSDMNILVNSIFIGLIWIGIVFFIILFIASYLVG